MPAGFISYPGIAAPQFMLAERKTGVDPGIAQIFCQPNTTFSPDTSGTATLSFGFNGVTVNWTNALCDRGTLQVTKTGIYQVFRIYDQRWMWKKAWINQAFNVRWPDGSIDPGNAFSLQQIITILLQKMGIATFDLSLVSSTEQPEVVCDHQRCVDVLDELLTNRGLVIVLNVDDSVVVGPRGSGTALPVNGDIFTITYTLDPPEVPYQITAVGQETLVQSMLKCVPVALDVDGSIQLADEVSYFPATTGWEGLDWATMNFIADPVAKECALRSLGKWYQVVSQADGSQDVSFGEVDYLPGEIVVETAWQYMPIKSKLLTTYTDAFGQQRRDVPFVSGTFWEAEQQANPPRAADTPDFTRVDKRDWTLNRENGLVIFKELAQKNPSGTFTFADVYLTCAYSVRDLNTYTQDRYERVMVLGGIGEEQYEIEELTRQIVVEYVAGTSEVDNIIDTGPDLDPEADAFLTSAANSFFTTAGNVVGYRGIYPFNLDGANIALLWRCAVPGEDVPWATLVSQYTDGIPQVPSERERRATVRNESATRRIPESNRRFHEKQKRSWP